MKKRFGFILLAFALLLLPLPAFSVTVDSVQVVSRSTAIAEGTDPAGVYVWDTAGILSSSEIEKLQERAAELADAYACGCYIVTVKDYQTYSAYSPLDAAEKIYTQLELGVGEDKDGEMLMLSMDDRDFAILAHGDFGNLAFTDYGKEQLDEVYLDNFRKNDWYGGFSDYLEQSAKYLKMASEGKPFDVDTDVTKLTSDILISFLMSSAVGIVLAIIICMALSRGMKSAVEATNANVYTVPGSARIVGRQDQFLRRSTSRRVIPRNTGGGNPGGHSHGGGGGTTVHSGGFSGHSGKF